MKKDIIKLLALGGQAENGKSNYCIEVNDKIFIIDSGFKFPDSDKLGIDVVIPSYNYLIEHINQVEAIIITHGHDDVMAGLPYLLQDLPNIPVYAPALTAEFVEQLIHRYEKHNKIKLDLNLIRIKRNDSVNISGVPFEFFPVTHSFPGSIGVAIWTNQGYIVYSSEFIIDFGAPHEFRCDLQKMIEIGKKGVLALLVESSYARNSGYTSPKHKLTNSIEHLFEDATGRIIISAYAQNVFRIKEIIELTRKYHRKIVFYGKDPYDQTNTIFRLSQKMNHPIFEVDNSILGIRENIGQKIKDRNYVILLTGSPQSIYNDIDDILDGGDDLLKIRKGDTIIVASPVLPGTEKIANRVHNNLYRTEAKISILKNRDLFSMHASSEDIKVMTQIFKPRYYIPMKGDYHDFVANGNIVKTMHIDDDHLILMDNGEKITFDNGQLNEEREIIDIEDVMIDGIGVGDVGLKVIDDRIKLSDNGVVIVGITIDKTTKKIIAQTDCQTRGFVYLKDSGYIIKELIAICEKVVGRLVEHPDTDIQDIRNTMREQCIRYIVNETGKKPVFIAVVVEV